MELSSSEECVEQKLLADNERMTGAFLGAKELAALLSVEKEVVDWHTAPGPTATQGATQDTAYEDVSAGCLACIHMLLQHIVTLRL